MPKRRTKGDGGLTQRHDHPDCPPRILAGSGDDGKPVYIRPEHRCKGRWVGTIDGTDRAGAVRRVYVYGRTQAEAKKKLDEKARAKADGTLVVGGGLTVEGWLRHWFDKIATASLKPQTIRGYRGYIDVHLIPALGKHRLSELRPDHIRAMHSTLQGKGLSPASVKQAHAILRKALNEAVYDGRLAANPAARVKSPSAPRNPRVGLDVEQAATVLASTREARWWLALLYGMRQGEVLGLRWCDVNFLEKTITIEQTLQRAVDGTQTFGSPKSRSSRRVLPLLPHLDVLLTTRRQADPTDDPTALVFRNSAGGPVDPSLDRKEWKALLAACDVPAIALHAARNTAASLMEAAGIPDRLVAQILGHSQVQITHGYQRAELARMRTALEGLAPIVALEPGGADEAPGALPRELPGPSA